MGDLNMAELATQAVSSRSGTGVRRRFYVGMAVVLLLMIVVGFWPSYFGPLLRGATQAPWVLHVHGAIFMGWMFLLVAQTVVAAQGKISLHRKLGNFGIGLGSLVFAMGLLISFVAPVMTYNAGTRTLDEAAAFLLIPLGDMALFGPLFFAAVAYRRKSELHKRLMILATIAIAFAAIFRMQAIGVPLGVGLTMWFALPAICIAYDLKNRGRIHPVYWIGIAGMIVAVLRLPFSSTEAWLSVSRPIIEALI